MFKIRKIRKHTDKVSNLVYYTLRIRKGWFRYETYGQYIIDDTFGFPIFIPFRFNTEEDAETYFQNNLNKK